MSMPDTGNTGRPARGCALIRRCHRPLIRTALACLSGPGIVNTTVRSGPGSFKKNPVMVPSAKGPVLTGS